MLSPFKDAHVLITGASEGIGLSISEELALISRRLTLVSRSQEKLDRARTRLLNLQKSSTNHPSGTQNQKNCEIVTISCDVTSGEQVRERLEPISRQLDQPEVIVNCAGFARPGFFTDRPISDHEAMLDLNYLAQVRILKIFVPSMQTNRRGTIINVSSMAGFIGLFGYTGYCASKFAVLGFSEALMRELEPYGINVHVLCPPNTRTPGLEQENQTKPIEVLQTEEKAKTLSPEQVAKYLVRKLPSRQHVLIPNLDGRLAFFLKRWFPSVLHQFVRRRATQIIALSLACLSQLACSAGPASKNDSVDRRALIPELEYIGGVQLTSTYGKRFDLSGLVEVSKRLFAVSDRREDNDLFEVSVGAKVFGIKSKAKLEIPGPLDLEGIDYCDGLFYFINESNASLWTFNIKDNKLTPIPVDYDQVNEDPTKWKTNAGLEGLAIDCAKQEAYLIKEREPRLIIRFDLKKKQTMESFNFPETESNDYADAKFEKGHLYLLERNGSAIAKVDPERKMVVAKVSYRKTSRPGKETLFGPTPYGLEEALLLRSNEIWLGVDNNGDSVTELGRSLGFEKSRSVILKFKRPKNF